MEAGQPVRRMCLLSRGERIWWGSGNGKAARSCRVQEMSRRQNQRDIIRLSRVRSLSWVTQLVMLVTKMQTAGMYVHTLQKESVKTLAQI